PSLFPCWPARATSRLPSQRDAAAARMLAASTAWSAACFRLRRQARRRARASSTPAAPGRRDSSRSLQRASSLRETDRRSAGKQQVARRMIRCQSRLPLAQPLIRAPRYATRLFFLLLLRPSSVDDSIALRMRNCPDVRSANISKLFATQGRPLRISTPSSFAHAFDVATNVAVIESCLRKNPVLVHI